MQEDFTVTDQVTVRLPPDLSRALKAASRRTQRKSSEIVRMALRQFLQVGAVGGSRPTTRGSLRRCGELLEDYADLPMDYADAKERWPFAGLVTAPGLSLEASSRARGGRP